MNSLAAIFLTQAKEIRKQECVFIWGSRQPWHFQRAFSLTEKTVALYTLNLFCIIVHDGTHCLGKAVAIDQCLISRDQT